MNFYKSYFNYMNLVFVTISLISISINSTAGLSFAQTDDDNKDKSADDSKGISSSLVDETKKFHNDDLKEPITQNDLLIDQYPKQYYICGYPQQVISDYNIVEKINCN